MEINFKLGNLELLPYKSSFEDVPTSDDIYNQYQIIKWTKDDSGKKYCFVIAFLDPCVGEEHDVRSVGSRPWQLESDEMKQYNKLIEMFYAASRLAMS